MRKAALLKTPLMVLALVGIMYAMKKLNRGAFTPAINQVLGVEDEARRANPVLPHIIWCDSRVVEIEKPGVFRLYQQGSKWLWEAHSKSHEVDFLSVEKWFASFCSIPAIPAPSQLKFEPFLKIKFVNGKTEAFTRKGEIIKWMDQSFLGHDLDEALSVLQKLADGNAS